MKVTARPPAPPDAGSVAEATRNRRRKIVAAVLLGVLPGVLGLLGAHVPVVENLEFAALDLLFLARGVRQPPHEVCVVAVDDDSYRELDLPDNRTWPRSLHARLVRTLRQHGARAVAFDILFTDGDPAAEENIELAGALREAGNVVLASKTEVHVGSHARVVQTQVPIAPFAAAARVADASLPGSDRNGVVRSAWLRIGDRPSLALATFEAAAGGASASAGQESTRLIDYYGPAGTVTTVSYYQALEPETFLPPDFFRGKVVLVGRALAVGIGPAEKDTFPTAFRGGDHPSTFGVEIHATIVANLLEGRRIDLLPPWIEALMLLVLPLIAAGAFFYFRPLLGVPLLILLEALAWAVGHAAFSRANLWVPVMIPSVIQLPVAYVASLAWYYVTEVRERERVRRAFSFYLAPEMISKILADPALLDLGGHEVSGTAMFTDIQGFTTIAEELGPPATATLLNAYFSRINGHIFRRQGTLIKFIGDAVFAIWGAPIPAEDHATLACSAALAIGRTQRLPTAREGHLEQNLVTRVGVHSGSMVVGNLGSAQRFDYTAIGDAVNVAARLEGLNKYFGTTVLASRAAIDRTNGAFVTRPLGSVKVVGKKEALLVLEVIGERGEATDPDPATLQSFDEALTLFGSRRFAEAADRFREVQSLRGGADGPSRFYLGLCERYASSPPPEDWDGTLVFESK